MSTLVEEKVVKPTWRRRLLKYFLGLVVLLVLAAIVAHLVHRASGNREWELVRDKKGVKVYAMKVPGQNLKKFLAVFRVKAKLSSIVGFMQDNESEIDVGFEKAREIERHGSQMNLTTWRSVFPRPYYDRDFVVRHTFTQNPANKEVFYAIQALPDRLPIDSCCVRVPMMNNDWQITPLPNGEVEIRWVIDMDIGGVMPYFMINEIHPKIMTSFGSKLQGYFNRPKYANMKYDWLVEP